MKAKDLGFGALLAASLATSAGAASIDVGKDILAKGVKPDWSLKISHGTQFALTRPGKPPVQATAPGAAISPAGVSWSAKAADGRPLNINLKSGACTLAGKRYPMSVQVTLAAETFSGCAS